MSGSTNKPSAEIEDLTILGFDSEYVSGPDGNRLVSYQIFGMHGGKTWSFFLDRQGSRMPLHALIGEALEAGKQAGVYKHFPTKIYLAVHWSIADLTMLADYGKLKTEFDSLRKTHASVQKPLTLTWTDANRHQRKIEIILRDSSLLVPQGKSLAHLGDLHGLSKIELPEGAIERMDMLLKQNRELFVRYAMRDAEISAKHAMYMAQLNYQWTGDASVPITLGGLAMAYSIAHWEASGVPWRAAMGHKLVEKKIFNGKGVRTIKTQKPLPGFLENHGIAVESYHGGRNETFYFGASPVRDYRDYDLAGAYSTVLAMTPSPIYDDVTHTTRVEDFGPTTMGFARVTFSFPASVRYPGSPVRTDFGLHFPRDGQTHLTAAEIFTAVKGGAKITIDEGIVLQTRNEFIFGGVIAEITKQRSKNKGNALLYALFKEMANSLYGKTGQALRPKKVFNSRTGQSEPLPPSKFSNPYIAAHVTGFVRALLAEILNSLPKNRRVISVTTDGFLTDATNEEMRAATSGPLAKIFAAARKQIAGNSNVLEVKHQVQQVLSWRTRGVATLVYLEGGKPVLAKAGIKLPGPRQTPDEENVAMIELFLRRTPYTEIEIELFRSLREIWHQGGDLTKKLLTRTARMDFDWKRAPAQMGTESVNGQSMLKFDTVPWRSVEEFLECRRQWEVFHRESGRCLHQEEDLRAFLDYLETAKVNDSGINRSIRGGVIDLALRAVCRAFVRGEWGFAKRIMQHTEFAKFLADGGYNVTVTDLKNAGRNASKLVRHCVPANSDVLDLVAYIKRAFPNFDATQLLVAPKSLDEPVTIDEPLPQLPAIDLSLIDLHRGVLSAV